MSAKHTANRVDAGDGDRGQRRCEGREEATLVEVEAVDLGARGGNEEVARGRVVGQVAAEARNTHLVVKTVRRVHLHLTTTLAIDH